MAAKLFKYRKQIKKVGRYADSVSGFHDRRKRKIILLFFVLAALMLFLEKMGKTSVSVIDIPIVYDQIPPGFPIEHQPEQKLSVELATSGFALLWYAKFPPQITVNASKALVVNDSMIYWVPPDYDLSAFFSPRDTVVSVKPDTIVFSMKNTGIKRVKIDVSALSATYSSGYTSFTGFSVRPDSVDLVGNAELLAPIGRISLHARVYRNLKAPVNQQVELALPEKYAELSIRPTKIEIRSQVVRFTSGKLLLPIRAVNVPEGYTAELFPSHVTVEYIADVRDFAGIAVSDFDVSANFAHVGDSREPVAVRLRRHPGNAHDISMNVGKVDFILKKTQK